MSAPRVPLNPEPIDALRRRFPAAIAEVIAHEDIFSGRRPAPSGEPAHVFDTEDGLRLIVSMERLQDGCVGTHISASFHTLEGAGLPWHDAQAWIFKTFAALSGDTRRPRLVAVAGAGIPHFFLERGH